MLQRDWSSDGLRNSLDTDAPVNSSLAAVSYTQYVSQWNKIIGWHISDWIAIILHGG